MNIFRKDIYPSKTKSSNTNPALDKLNPKLNNEKEKLTCQK